MSKLTPKQEQFCREYLIDQNATQAAVRAGYSEKTAGSQGERLLKNVEIARRVKQVQEQRLARTETDADWVLKKLKILAEFNINKFIRVVNGNPVFDFSTATDDDWYCISEITFDTINKAMGDDLIEVERVKLKSVDKLRAIQMAGNHVNIQAFNEKTTVEVVDKSTILAKARKRADKSRD